LVKAVQTYQAYFKREFDKKRENSGVLARFVLFLAGMPDQPTATGFYYSFSYADVKFIMLNTNRLNNNALTDDQYNWLEGQLKNKTEKWTVVAMHNPVYSAGTYGSKPGKTAVSDKLKTQLGKIFAEYGVDIVLQGHDHCVSRTYPINGNQMPTADTTEIYDGIEYSVDPQGVIYVMNGPAGNQVAGRLYAGYDARYFSYAAEAKASSWAEIEIDGNKLTVTAKYYDAGSSHTEVGHKWGIIKKV
jgi:3',5'-cyclic AMP phosphodiesterase CpdA